MPNNFKLTGDYYVSKFGNDSWSGTSPDAPKRTVLNAFTATSPGNKSVIIGSGQYYEVGVFGWSLPNVNLTGDGTVVLDGINSGAIFANNFSGGGGTITNITFRNYPNISWKAVGGGGPTLTFVNCIFINCIIVDNGSTYNNCRFINCSVTALNPTLSKCLCVNTYFYASSTTVGVNVSTNTYYKNSLITTTNTITAANFNWNVFQDSAVAMLAASTVTSGIIQDTFDRYYDLSKASFTGSGTISDPYGRSNTAAARFNYPQHRIAYPTYNLSSSTTDPKFNSLEDMDFTVQADSPLLAKASDGTNIAAVTYAMRRSAQISFSGSSATVDPSLIFQYDNYIISGSELTGSITSAPIAVSPLSSSKVIQKVTYNGLLAFNKDTGSASGSNQNVPDFDTFTSASGNAAANPDRLVYYMRHTTGSSIPVSDAGWDNGGLWTAGQYNVFEWNTKPSIDNLGVGNGSGSFNAAASPTYIQATYVQMQVKLRNDYLL